jgi:hypothetical protein
MFKAISNVSGSLFAVGMICAGLFGNFLEKYWTVVLGVGMLIWLLK